MLEPLMEILGSKRVILASSSPRREEILRNAGLKFEKCPSLYPETLNPADFSSPGDFAIATAAQKVAAIKTKMDESAEPYDLIIGADTVVFFNGHYFGKPKTYAAALECLKLLSGKTHLVYTGVCLLSHEFKNSFYEMTEVTFGKLPEEVIKAYINTEEPFDKAGGYGIQGKGATLIEKINGDFYNVMGLPLHRLCSNLHSLYGFK